MDPIYYFYVRDTGTDSPFVIGSQLIASFLSLSLFSLLLSLQGPKYLVRRYRRFVAKESPPSPSFRRVLN